MFAGASKHGLSERERAQCWPDRSSAHMCVSCAKSVSFCSFSRACSVRWLQKVAYLLSLAVVLGQVVLGGLLGGSRDDPLTLLELLGLLGGHFGGFGDGKGGVVDLSCLVFTERNSNSVRIHDQNAGSETVRQANTPDQSPSVLSVDLCLCIDKIVSLSAINSCSLHI